MNYILPLLPFEKVRCLFREDPHLPSLIWLRRSNWRLHIASLGFRMGQTGWAGVNSKPAEFLSKVSLSFLSSLFFLGSFFSPSPPPPGSISSQVGLHPQNLLHLLLLAILLLLLLWNSPGTSEVLSKQWRDRVTLDILIWPIGFTLGSMSTFDYKIDIIKRRRPTVWEYPFR